ncbi:MAG: NAD(P)H-hydrate dehydratase [Bacteroidetes bacterium]|nr:NAD(P)H-hydrate dehydratase [Bacteroidota bacterium]
MKIVTTDTIIQIDRTAQEEFHIPGLVLMEQAGIAVFDILDEHIAASDSPDKKMCNITVIAGPGNNGGDALVAARAASVRGYKRITILLVREKTNELMQQQRVMCESIGIPLFIWGDAGVQKILDESDILIDGISGTGLSGDIRGPAREVIESIGKIIQEKVCKPFILSIDLPAGMYNEGGVDSLVLDADITVTMGLPKTLLYYPHNRLKCGLIICRNPGFPAELLKQSEKEGSIISLESIKLPKLPKNAYKNTKGHAGIFAGSSGMTGAAILSSTAALRVRAGMVSLYADPDVYPAAIKRTASLLVNPAAFNEVIPGSELAEKFTSLLVGPGWSTSESHIPQLIEILESGLPTVVDADGITLYAQLLKAPGFKNKNTRCILTPHPGEFFKLSGISIKENPEKVISAVKEFAVKNCCTLVYKSHVTYIASVSGEFSVIDGMNPAMGTAGSGDVLAGIITGLLAQGFDVYKAACLGAAIHQKAGRIAYEKIGIFTSEDLLSVISSLSK